MSPVSASACLSWPQQLSRISSRGKALEDGVSDEPELTGTLFSAPIEIEEQRQSRIDDG
jgi:hypothetical protein